MDDLISRQEAIDALDKIFPADPMRNDYTQGITCGAALATEYIKQFPSAQPETHEERTETHACDLISRQDAIDAVQKLRDAEVRQYGKVPCKGYWELTAAMNAVRCVPTAQPERKKGMWIEQDDSWDGVYYECSACGEPWTTIDGTPWDNGMHFCPNCGAEMLTEDKG